MKLVIWHTDPYPTAPGVYLGCFPGMGHEVTWVVSETGGNGSEYHMEALTSLPCVESAAPRIPDGPAVSPEPSTTCAGVRGPK